MDIGDLRNLMILLVKNEILLSIIQKIQ